jgi:hypothetical protein
MFNFGYIGGLVASWTIILKRKNNSDKSKLNFNWVIIWLCFCLGVLIGYFIGKLIW